MCENMDDVNSIRGHDFTLVKGLGRLDVRTYSFSLLLLGAYRRQDVSVRMSLRN